MVEGFVFWGGDGGFIFGGPDGFGAALQEEEVFAGGMIAGDGPLDVLRGAVMAFYLAGDFYQGVDLFIGETRDILAVVGDFLVADTRAVCSSRK